MATSLQIRASDQIQHHLLLIYDLQPTMSVGFGPKSSAAVGRFIYDPKKPEEIVLKTVFLENSKNASGELRVNYVIEGYEHHFVSRIKTISPVDNVSTFFKIHSPTVINAINRRNYLRFCPGCREPVQATLYQQEGKGSPTYVVQDISAGGFSFFDPAKHQLPTHKKEINVQLRLPNHYIFPARVTLRNILKRDDGIRIGTEFVKISAENQKYLIDYILERKFNLHNALKIDSSVKLPILCIIQDNCRIDDALSYLEKSYRLIRQDVKGDWKPMADITPDLFIFNVNSIRFDMILLKLRSLTSLQKIPAIVITDKKQADASCDATFLSEFKDPAMLIDAVEYAIGNKRDMQQRAPSLFKAGFDPVEDQKKILIVDLKGGFPDKAVESINSKIVEAKIVNNLQGILDTIRKIKPVMIVIHSDADPPLANLLKMLKFNIHAKSVPLSILVDEKTKKSNVIDSFLDDGTNLFSSQMDPVQLADRLIALLVAP